ncbi:gliding motility protein GldL [Pedobacter sp. ISL-68]|uniref:type IX secretion system motor protein PorL/GldL n=1 Tax=unclassified Pedobacter TaxID=2628915 RepID=UPI001BEBD855|nr:MULTISPECIES: gliding motility protein GldL [unclassified Pedobacter]MBT2562947.1 gliding motility protein GldL [Pedobacter sp. ISL-64]MBT2593496.1 gliding motility protein GldL [Pedobacter sp. ISL-68]MDQ0637316.1 gliding motility-associated protein GldL [Pedobacter sp. W3I1]
MAAKKQPGWLHVAISWGASIVIIGALFKILHIGGIVGSYMIGLGLGIEAILFFLTGFFPPEPEPAWERVYPELKADFKGELPTASARPVAASASNTAALDKMLSDAKIGPELIESLGSGLRTFGDKVATISNVADASTATNEFTGKIKTASAGFDNLSASFDKATANLKAMGESTVDSQAYHDQVNNLAKNLSALNAVYELELQDSSAHLKSMNKFYSNLSLTMQNFNESMEDSKQFKEEVNKLAKNLSSLNAIYGNMLSAMNGPRV